VRHDAQRGGGEMSQLAVLELLRERFQTLLEKEEGTRGRKSGTSLIFLLLRVAPSIL
jgi:hypothetical protein